MIKLIKDNKAWSNYVSDLQEDLSDYAKQTAHWTQCIIDGAKTTYLDTDEVYYDLVGIQTEGNEGACKRCLECYGCKKYLALPVPIINDILDIRLQPEQCDYVAERGHRGLDEDRVGATIEDIKKWCNTYSEAAKNEDEKTMLRYGKKIKGHDIRWRNEVAETWLTAEDKEWYYCACTPLEQVLLDVLKTKGASSPAVRTIIKGQLINSEATRAIKQAMTLKYIIKNDLLDRDYLIELCQAYRMYSAESEALTIGEGFEFLEWYNLLDSDTDDEQGDNAKHVAEHRWGLLYWLAREGRYGLLEDLASYCMTQEELEIHTKQLCVSLLLHWYGATNRVEGHVTPNQARQGLSNWLECLMKMGGYKRQRAVRIVVEKFKDIVCSVTGQASEYVLVKQQLAQDIKEYVVKQGMQDSLCNIQKMMTIDMSY